MAGFRKKGDTTFIPPIVVKEHKVYEFKGGVVKYWTVRWHHDGRPLNPVFEKRDFYQTEQGLRMNKAKGLNLEDFKWLQENWESVVASMTGGPVPEAQPAPEPEAQDVFA